MPPIMSSTCCIFKNFRGSIKFFTTFALNLLNNFCDYGNSIKKNKEREREKYQIIFMLKPKIYIINTFQCVEIQNHIINKNFFTKFDHIYIIF